MIIYKILTREQWDDLQVRGKTDGAPVDLADGFIHFSTATQVRETAARHFAGQDSLWLVAVDTEDLADLRWEPSRGGDLFPHLYAPLHLDRIVSSVALPLGPDGHLFPGDIP